MNLQQNIRAVKVLISKHEENKNDFYLILSFYSQKENILEVFTYALGKYDAKNCFQKHIYIKN